MIKLIFPDLSQSAIDKLADYQQEIRNAGAYTKQVHQAEFLFKKYNIKSNATFKEVRSKLDDMCCGATRCHYCEDSAANQVEHHAPKSLFPDKCFVWTNYCYACNPCNGPKSNKFAIYRSDNGAYYEIPPHPRKAKTLSQPPAGDSVLLNPRFDNPLDYFFLDISYSFEFAIFPDEGTIEYQRAEYTRRILKLNRPLLAKARRSAYDHFRLRLQEFISQRDSKADSEQLDKIKQNLQEEHHQTVWQEMKRQQATIPVLSTLFMAAPEALDW